MNEAILCLALLLLLLAGTAGAVPDERPAMRAWAEAALLGEVPRPAPPAPGLEVRRQDHATLQLRQSVRETPLQIGEKRYAHGLGTHSVSEIVVRLPRPGKEFTADAGIDNNWDTAGQKGSVVFAVEVAVKDAFRSDLRKGSHPPLPVRVALDGAREFTLRVLDGGDGSGWDQADWADAAVTLDDGTRLWLDELPVVGPQATLAAGVPFSFRLGGKPSAELLPGWNRTLGREPAGNGRERWTSTYTDPATGLEVACEAIHFGDAPAMEWVLRFRNTGATDTPLLESILPLDLGVALPAGREVLLHRLHGSTCQPTDFLPIEEKVAPGADLRVAPFGGRSSNGTLPFFNLDWADGGLVGAIGWSGQWAMRLRREAGGAVSLQAGQQTTRLVLHPGESIRTPRILLVMWQGGDRMRGHNLLRRLLLAHYVPRAGTEAGASGEVVVPPVTQNTWFTYNTGNGVTEENQLAAIHAMAPLGVEGYWLDAGWFEGGWPSGVGSWVPRKDAFPRGLKPLGDAAHGQGMKFVVWFEPERVSPKSRIGTEHPEWVLRKGEGDGLYNLGDPAARAWLSDHLSGCIRESGIDIYRNDFNIDPLPFWQAADAPERQGMAEIRYVEGLYWLWDELLRRHPGLAIDNCASGGRRIDLETIRRSFPLWRSDTQCGGKALPVQDQVQTAGLSLYVPLHAAGVWGFDPYVFRSVGTTGTSICLDTRGGFPAEAARRMIEEMKSLRPLYLGDYHPLLPIGLDERQWCAWQFDRPELGKGFALFFRRAQSPYAAIDASLRGLDAAATYRVTFADTGHVETRKGSELARLRLEIEECPGSALVRYEKVE